MISGLLDVALQSTSNSAFDVRLSACECLKAYFHNHGPIKSYFLRRAINGLGSDGAEKDNIFIILIQDPQRTRGGDPYRLWIAAVLLFHLLYEDEKTKSIAIKISEGDASNGEEEVTCLQSLSANLIMAEQRGDDERILIGFLMILCGWLYEDHDAVNDFLGEGSNLQSIAQIAKQNVNSRVLVSGLSALLLGIVYEFSTKDSPVPRATVHQVLTGNRMGREVYVDRITKLREHAVVRDFEVLHQGLNARQSTVLPEVYFDRTFMDFLKDNFSLILRAIDRDPGLEVPVVANGIQKGISRELVDSLKGQVDERNQTIQKLESQLLTFEGRLGQEQADHRKAKESAVVELNRIRSVNDALHRNHEEESKRITDENSRARHELKLSHEATLKSLQEQMQRLKEESDADATRVRQRNDAEIEDLKSQIQNLEVDLDKSGKEHAQDLHIAHEDFSAKLSSLESRLQRAEERAADAEARATRLMSDVEAKEEARKTIQAELDDLLMVLGDLEEKRAKDRVYCLATHETVNPILIFFRNDYEHLASKSLRVRRDPMAKPKMTAWHDEMD